jgi:hypothetical protein
VLETADGVRSQVATRKLHIVAAFVSLGPRLVAYAKQFIGVPYVYWRRRPVIVRLLGLHALGLRPLRLSAAAHFVGPDG